MTNNFDEELREFALITSAHGVRYVARELLILPSFGNWSLKDDVFSSHCETTPVTSTALYQKCPIELETRQN